MPRSLRVTVLLATLVALVVPAAAHAAVRAGRPFPSNLLTVRDATQLTGLRVDLPRPDCGARPSDCQDVAVLDGLDGFNVQPRISIPFSGAIDPATVSSSTVFLVRLGCGTCANVGINQIVWHPVTNTLTAESDELLAQDATYLLVATNRIRDTAGRRVRGEPLEDEDEGRDPDKAYFKQLRKALRFAGLEDDDVAAASLFTTQSVTAILERIRAQIDASTPPATTFALGTRGERTVFPAAAAAAIVVNRQTGTTTFSTSTIPAAVPVFPGAIGTVAFGRYVSPDYENARRVIPDFATRTGVPVATGTNDIYFNLYLPAGAEPAGGWPVAIFGHGFTDSKQGAPIAVASTLAHAGIATIAINVVGHGGGPLGTLTVLPAGVTLPAGGRGIDQDGNGTIDSTEGVSAAPPFTLVGNRDGLRQTIVDLMQLVRAIQGGIDVDGDGRPDLDASKMGYAGQSFGGIYGTSFLAVEPDVAYGVPNVPGGPIIEIARLSPSFRPLVGLVLITRTPSLYNNPAPDAFVTNFNENLPLRNQPPVVDAVPGADAIQQLIDNTEWAQQAANPVAFAPHLLADPLAGVPAKAVIIQFAKGDKTVPNPTATAIIRAGGLTDRATYFRNDIAVATIPGIAHNPHTFLTNLGGAGTGVAVAAQQQIATFLASRGATTIDPDGAGPLFETPIAGVLPEELNFIP